MVHVDDDLVAFGELVPDGARGLPHGTPVHSLLVHLGDAGPEQLELNDQANTIAIDALTHVELSRDEIRFELRTGAGPFAGRVSLASDLELFEDAVPDGDLASYERYEDVQLSSLRVRFTLDDARFEALREKLAPLL